MRDFGDQRIDRVVALLDDSITPAFGTMMQLDRVLTGVVNFGQSVKNRVGIAGTQ